MAFLFCVAAVLPSGRVQAAIQIHPAGQAPRHALGIPPGAFLMGKRDDTGRAGNMDQTADQGGSAV